MSKRVYFKTFGCRTNLFDSQVMMSSLRSFEIAASEEDADIVVINSCTVTNSADSSVRAYISQIEKMGNIRIYLTGCGAHTKGESLYDSGRVYGVFGQSEKAKIESILHNERRIFELGDLNYIDEAIVTEFVGKSRAFIKIQEGCSFRCSYCIIPSVRGDSRSLDEARILEQVRILAEHGFGEFILTGTNVGSYGQGRKSSVAALMKKMAMLRGVRRIRIGSLEPIQINEEFFEILDEPWLERHLHIAIQHSSPKMLKLMNRRNRVDSDIALFQTLAERGFALGTDFIVAHPGESEAVWEEAVTNLRRYPLTHIHAFTYSKRDDTPSAKMQGEVNGKIAKERMAQLNALVAQNNFAFRKNNRLPLDVLVESRRGDYYHGYDQFFNKVSIRSNEDIAGEWKRYENYTVKEDANYV